jgi:hypothetical protein
MANDLSGDAQCYTLEDAWMSKMLLRGTDGVMLLQFGAINGSLAAAQDHGNVG